MYKVLLSFDTEEFDVPKERGVDISLEDSMRISDYGTNKILDILDSNNVRATFFCTTTFAKNAPATIRRILAGGHEIAAHGCDHWRPKPSDVAESKRVLEEITGKPVLGYRQPRMFPVSETEIKRCGYLYNSSLNPTFIPGHYMHLDKPRTPFIVDGVLQIPASVTPLVRFPMFWLAYHHLPGSLYRLLAKRVIRHDGYFTTYFHPWEFFNSGSHPELKLSWMHNHNAGREMQRRLDLLIKSLKDLGAEFVTFTPFAREEIQKLTKNG
ncbi:MAG: polysaccharide deacetylase family protein [Candidatus Amulumruptor caecigallinarius]|nr:polysaccharide deacetylase family protein [Candidatus Amulumruptor caecigallinarius]